MTRCEQEQELLVAMREAIISQAQTVPGYLERDGAARPFIKAMVEIMGLEVVDAYNGMHAYVYERLEGVLNATVRGVGHGRIPYPYLEAAYGIRRAINTGRLNGATVVVLKALPVRTLLHLIYLVRMHCPTQGDVPKYLMGLNLVPQAEGEVSNG